jgi:hypothetical protein
VSRYRVVLRHHSRRVEVRFGDDATTGRWAIVTAGRATVEVLLGVTGLDELAAPLRALIRAGVLTEEMVFAAQRGLTQVGSAQAIANLAIRRTALVLEKLKRATEE